MLDGKPANRGEHDGAGLELGGPPPRPRGGGRPACRETACGSEVEAQAEAPQPAATHLCVRILPTPQRPISWACRGANRTHMNGTYCQYQFCYRHARSHHSNHTLAPQEPRPGPWEPQRRGPLSGGPQEAPPAPSPLASDVCPLWGPLLSCGSRFENLPRLPSHLCPERLGLPAPPCT